MRAAQADQQAGENVNQITQLDLKLQGVIMASDPEKSWAIIGEENSQQLFKIGDSIPPANGVTLEKVEDLRVILNNNGKREALWLSGEDGIDGLFAASGGCASTPPPAANVQQATVTQEQFAERHLYW